ncbi:hypothetical protein KAR48_02850 [bacterium]|nr:hypothetical protein [bacterium]
MRTCRMILISLICSVNTLMAQIPAAAISLVDADKLSRTISTIPGTKVKLTLSCRQLSDGMSSSLIGEIRGLEVLTLINRLAIRPKRTIRVVFFMNEEFGLSGAVEYGKWAAKSGETHWKSIPICSKLHFFR